MRWGLIGTGFWATDVHAPALQAAPEVDFAGVWGRDAARTAALGAQVGVAPFDDLQALLDVVDGLSFAVPPHVQAPLATRAAAAGKHLLLEKPIALTPEDTAALVNAVDEAGVATAAFFTRLFTPEGRQWVTDVSRSPWEVGNARWLGANFAEGSPFDTPWRREKGGLWDVGPHVVALLTTALGPITEVRAKAGVRDVVHLTFEHAAGATSTATVSISASREAADTSLELFGPAGRLSLPPKVTHSSIAAQEALRRLVGQASGTVPSRTGDSVCDVHFGAYVTKVLLEAQWQVTGSGGQPPPSRSMWEAP